MIGDCGENSEQESHHGRGLIYCDGVCGGQRFDQRFDQRLEQLIRAAFLTKCLRPINLRGKQNLSCIGPSDLK